MIIIPEFIFLDTFEKILNFLRTDLKTNEDDSFIYHLFEDSSILEKYNFYDQCKAVLTTKKSDPKYLEVNVGFNNERSTLPTLHLMIDKDDISGEDGLGISEGYEEIIHINETDYSVVYNRRYHSSCNVLITSTNVNEVILIYRVLLSILQVTIGHFNVSGIEDVWLSGAPINIDESIVPRNVFAKVLQINFAYEVNVKSLYIEKYIKSITFTGKPVSDQADQSNS